MGVSEAIEVPEVSVKYDVSACDPDVPPGYKQTEVGVIPEDWGCVSVRDAATASANAIVGGPFGSDLVSSDYSVSGVPVIRGQNMSARLVSGDFVFVTELKAKSLSANLAYPEDLIFTQRGTLGQVSIVPNAEYKCYLISQSQMKVSLNRTCQDPCFVLQYFASSAGQKQITASAIQTGVPHTNLGILRAYRFPSPPIFEQRAISTALSDMDALLDCLDRLIAKKRNLKQAAMQQLLTGQTRLPGFEGEWDVRQLGEEAIFLKGKGLPKTALDSHGTELCVHYGELFTQYSEEINSTLSRTRNSPDHFRSIANDVLMPTSDVTPRGLAKASCVMQDRVVLGGDILVIRLSPERVNGIFLSYVIRSEAAQVLSLVTGTTVFHLYGSDMKKFIFPIPPLEEQIAIVKVLSDIGAEIEVLEQRRNKTRDLKQAMMQELLTGRTRLI
ncbi:MAG: restriction endonuclease subunit S [Pseudohongiella sp.]|nr:restriction endonuclease subunit S [Pseudohongiella sp.]